MFPANPTAGQTFVDTEGRTWRFRETWGVDLSVPLAPRKITLADLQDRIPVEMQLAIAHAAFGEGNNGVLANVLMRAAAQGINFDNAETTQAFDLLVGAGLMTSEQAATLLEGGTLT